MKALYFIRFIILLSLIGLAMKPVTVRPDPGLPLAWAILVDDSKSMAVKDPTTRLNLAKVLAQSLKSQYSHYDLFRFSETAAPLEEKDLENLKPKGEMTNFAEAIKKIFGSQQYRGAFFLTDGRQVGAGDAVSAAASIGRPLVLVGYGNRNLFKDIWVRSIQSPPFAFKNVKTSLTAVISAVGYQGKKVSVQLKEKGRVLGLQTLTLADNETESSVTFNWVPRRLGTRTLTVEVSQFPGEFTTRNNIKKVTLDVGRDRFRVLYICGKPGPEYGFLRHQFKADPAVELVTFVILRNAGNVVNVPDAELSLIPFPTQDVLINQMASFDLIVFEEFSYQKFGLSPQVLYAIRKKVKKGGSFLVMGGPEMLGPGSPYAIPGIREMIPVEIGSSKVQVMPGSARFQPTSYRHPILRLAKDPKENKVLWSRLPEVEEITLGPKVKPGATVLGEVEYGGRRYPVLTAWQYGKGRVAVLSTRTTWRFAMIKNEKGGDSLAYQKFWKNMVLWLTHAEQFKTVRVSMEKKFLPFGEEGIVRVWATDEYYKPLSNVEVKLQIKGPTGTFEDVSVHRETQGVFAGTYSPQVRGDHTAKAWVTKNKKSIGRDTSTFSVIEGFNEQEDLRPDFDHLKQLALATGGRFVTGESFSMEAFEEYDATISEKVGRKILIWNSPWVFWPLLLLMGAEWYFRKRRGLP